MSIRAFFFIGCLFLVACAKAPQYQPLALTWPEREQRLSELKNWQFRGDVLIKVPQHKFSANMYWQQENNNQYHMVFFGPLGIGSIRMDGSSDAVCLQDNDGKKYCADSPEVLMQQQLGWSLPVSSLYYWVRGLPAPKPVTNVNYDAFHRLAQLEQEGWNIRYTSYYRLQSVELPQNIIFSRPDFFIELTIDADSWQLEYPNGQNR